MRQLIWIGLLGSLLFAPSVGANPNLAVEAALEIDSKAHQRFANGQYEDAITLWKEALVTFENKNYELGISGAMVQIAHSQEALGYPIQACQTLQELLKANPYLCQPNKNPETNELPHLSLSENHVIAAITFANLLRDFGLFEPSQRYLVLALEKANELNNDRLTAGAKMGMGNLLLMQLKLKRDRFMFLNQPLTSQEIQEVQDSLGLAYEYYESALNSVLDDEARLKLVQLHQEHWKYVPFLGTDREYQSKIEQIYSYLNNLAEQDFSNDTPIDQARKKLEIAQIHFSAWQEKQPENQSRVSTELILRSFSLGKESIDIGKKIGNEKILSKGYQHIGKLYLSSGQDSQAIQGFNLASQYAYIIDATEQLYKAQYELAKIFEKQGKTNLAASYYESAIKNSQEVEWDLSSLDNSIRIDFQEKIRPIFDDYLELLLTQDQPEFQTILDIREQLKLSELQNYLQCGLSETVSDEELLASDPTSVIFNVLKLKEEYHVIVQFSSNSFQYFKPDDRELQSALNRVKTLLDNDSLLKTPDGLIIPVMATLHREMISPFLPLLKPDATLLFSLDTELQRLPLAMLHDGHSYLIESHPIALIGPKQYSPKRLTEKLDVFFTGISDFNPNFPSLNPLPAVKDEVKSISQVSNDISTLLNNSFTASQFLKKLSSDTPIVHVATHGSFSSNPDETFLVAWDQKINIESLSQVIRNRAESGNTNPIDLLLLSACQTAKGDRFAVLGIAGFAIQSGARSTIATLWQSNDPATALLMELFYQNLAEGNTKAASLRNAQLAMLRNTKYRNPYYWSNFILLGSWL